ncbi:MAG: hypothetical protein HY289_13815 [Planctomycetes bacterium]|nr:hypothetical protein [Planctomycetota bacterium]
MKLFASIVIERMPLTWSTLPDGLNECVQSAGAIAAVAIALVLIARSFQRETHELNIWIQSDTLRSILPMLKACTISAGVGYLVLVLAWLGTRINIPGLRVFLPRELNEPHYTIGDWILTLSGLLAVGVVAAPLAIDLITRISWGRIYAIARLSWKEAIRGRVIWVFGAMALVFLFADWFVPHKPEDQLRSYVRVVYWSMTPLFLMTAGILGSFSIPDDVKNSSIHTIVTKPVEKFEVVLGRFLGYGSLMTVGLFAVACLSLIYVMRGVNEDAKAESYTARVPQYAFLHFAGTKDSYKGDSVGREWGYRSYITGPTRQKREPFRQYAIWDFFEFAQAVRQRDVDHIFEFSFDIFRLSKGEEGKGVHCSFTFVDVAKFTDLDPNRQAQELEPRVEALKKQRTQMREAKDKELEAAKAGEEQYDQAYRDIEVKLVEQHGIYQVLGEEVTDYHTQYFRVPPEVFKALVNKKENRHIVDGKAIPVVRCFVSVDIADQAQMVGVAQQDFYLVAFEKPFWQNFLKGIVGMWCTHMLVLGIAIACSTYLSSVISFLATAFLFNAGLFRDYLLEIAEKRVAGGGPLESSVRLGTKLSPLAPLEDSPTKTLLLTADQAFSWWVGRLLNGIPDVGRHDLHQYVANGYDIGWIDVLLVDNGLPLFGYLLPWAILAYYMMKYREIANPS